MWQVTYLQRATGSLIRFDFHQPVANAASEKLTEAKMRIEECKDNLDIASRRVRQSKALLKKLRDTRETFDKELDTFWSTDEHRLQERYERSVSLLEELDREDWCVVRFIDRQFHPPCRCEH